MIIDSHCHIDFEDFDNDREQVINRATAENINKIIVPGVTKNNWNKIKSCCEEYSGLYPCYGLHPYFINKHQKSDIDDLISWIEINKPVAIGECGLDFFLKNLDLQLQTYYFEKQLDIALDYNLPVVIHARKSTESVIKAIKQRPGLRGMIHSYSGSYEQALQLIKLGFYLSFGGPVTYEKSSRLRKLVQQLPLEAILVETDAPDQPVANAKERRNEPLFILEVIHNIAKLHNTSDEIISNITSKNSCELFNLPAV
ncbi:MAG: DNAase [endosymbiont of Galathealinum brachiosum]|uniref:DNAase n=1 Tax=endosymbiont of Galathealinum brachiosum TaxID=2200906 RepID=A0A370DCI9_9GAMM|nr:MAG: DNAase [endosymbiont of Galathealinum brachiosum]